MQAGGLPAISRWSGSPSDRHHRAGKKQIASRRDASQHRDVASTYLSLHYHLVFSTKNREPLIAEAWAKRFHEYLGGTISGLVGFPQGVGGMPDHVHLLVGLKSTHCLADFVRELKKSSSAWVRSELGIGQFAWQEGYGAFTVSATSRDGVRRYIANQEEHHRKKSFREELIELLERSGVNYDPKYFD